MTQQIKIFADVFEHLNLIPRTHFVEKEKLLLQIVHTKSMACPILTYNICILSDLYYIFLPL